MTDLSLFDPRRRVHGARAQAEPRLGLRVVLFPAFAFASAVGVLVGHAAPGDGDAFEPNLILLLRFMAFVKFASIVAALALVTWRLSRPVPRGVALGYVGAVAIMAVAPGLIWELAHIGLAAGLFHGGLLGFLILAWKDQGAFSHIVLRPTPSAGSRAGS